MSDICSVIKLHIDALVRTRGEKDLWDAAVLMAAVKNEIKTPVVTAPYPEHPGHAAAMRHNREMIREFASNPLREAHPTIGIHDSLIALRAEQCTSVDLPCGVSGLGGRQYIRLMHDVKAVLDQYKINPGFLVLGCIVGNMLLNRYSWGQCVSEFQSVYAESRALWPDAKIILYGLPPVFDEYLTQHTWQAEQLMIWKVAADVKAGNNAVYVSLKKMSIGGVWPRTKLSSDVVHLTATGFIRFDRLLNEAHRAPAGSVLS